MVEEYVGVCIGESSAEEVLFISKRLPHSGEYVILNYDDKEVLGMVEGITRGSPAISGDILDPEVVEKILEFESIDDNYVRGVVKLLGEVSTDTLQLPRAPPPPGTKILRAPPGVLKEIFSQGEIRIGRLLSHPKVEVYLDANKMLTRHLAVLAITGAGKSNTVSVLLNGILELGGMPVIFDIHSEYINSDFAKGESKRIEPRINPRYMAFGEFKNLLNIQKDAYVQERFIRGAYKTAKDRIAEGGRRDFIEQVIKALTKVEAELEEEGSKTGSEKNALAGVINKVNDFKEKYRGLVDPNAPDIIHELEQGKANAINLGHVDEDFADVVVSHVLRKLLGKRKNRSISPAFCILEEAHILAPAYRSTLSKYWIDRIAREGRKFGVGLCMVSQRPKSLDQNSLSQANNFIIMRLVEPTDQRHVQQSSERLSDDLLAQLTSLNIGEAVILGLMTEIPALVKIDKFEGKRLGGDPDIVGEWQEKLVSDKKTFKREEKEVEDLYKNM